MKATQPAVVDAREIFAPTPALYVVHDIETGHAPKKVIDATIKRWKAPSNMKDEEKIEARRKEYAKKVREKSALLDAAPIICIANRTDKIAVVFNGMSDKEYTIEGVETVPCGNERGMLIAYREWLDKSSNEETALVGFNLFAFDMPKLRAAYVRHRLRLPGVLQPRPLDKQQPAVDIMRLFLKYFTTEKHGDRMISLEEVLDRLGLPEYKTRVNGAQVPGLHKRKKFKEILTYAAIDAIAEWTAYLLLTSQESSME